MNEQYVYEILTHIKNNPNDNFYALCKTDLTKFGRDQQMLVETLNDLVATGYLDEDESKMVYSITKKGESFYLQLKDKFDRQEVIENLSFQKLSDEVYLLKDQIADYSKTKSQAKNAIIIAFISALAAIASAIAAILSMR